MLLEYIYKRMEITEPAPMIPVAEPVTAVATSKYSRGKIYAIRSPNTDLYYAGSTCEALSKRLSCHNQGRKKYLAGKSNFVTSYTILDAGDAYIELIENFPCDSRDALHKREGEIQRERRSELVNKNVAGRTCNEYREENRAEINVKQSIARKDHVATCPHCQKVTRRDYLSRHIKKMHSTAPTDIAEAPELAPRSSPRKRKKRNSTITDTITETTATGGIIHTI